MEIIEVVAYDMVQALSEHDILLRLLSFIEHDGEVYRECVELVAYAYGLPERVVMEVYQASGYRRFVVQ